MPKKITSDDSHCTVIDISLKMAIIFAYYCTSSDTIAGKSKELAKIIKIKAAGHLKQTADERTIKSITISTQTIKIWADSEKKSCEESKVTGFAELLEIDPHSFKYDKAHEFLEKFMRAKIDPGVIFSRFSNPDTTEYSRYAGFYRALYNTPNEKISTALLWLGKSIDGRPILKFCCTNNNKLYDYSGLWAIDDNSLYAFFDGPPKDGVSNIVASLPPLAAPIESIEGILSSLDMSNNLASPFSSTIIILPIYSNKELEKLVNEEPLGSIWGKLQKDIPNVCTIMSLEKETGDILATIMKNGTQNIIISKRKISE